ncbi:hypothetical protein RN001_001345 [Aquatica leii]|uniref:Carboxylesterase type B domain-containing protein n=1 Tax=Aquatica leii TaxID=1421715 RepID=A0AAN7SL63_9COLE|nr:hypothetical protein RN001_001345 [Aquatica leii]
MESEQDSFRILHNLPKDGASSGTPYSFRATRPCVRKDEDPTSRKKDKSTVWKKTTGSEKEDYFLRFPFVERLEGNFEKITKPLKLLPVMIWIHGGAFVCGSSKTELCGPDFLITQNIVLVTFNYRLGLLGFLSFKDPTVNVPGNAGLKDQVLVLKWVQKYICEFNGNNKNVTLFGQDAGAACVHLHMLSPLSKDLFHKVIMQSGCALNPWVNGLQNTGRLVGKLLNVKGSDYEILEHLKSISVEELFRVQETLSNENRVDVIWLCSPVIENRKFPGSFLIDTPINIITSGNFSKVPIIIGYTSREGMFWDIYNQQLTGKSKIITDFTKVIPNNLNCRRNSLLSNTIADQIEKFYYGSRLSSTRMGRHPRFKKMDPLFQLVTDVFFLRGIFATIKNHLEIASSIPIYYYKFCYDTPLNIFKQMATALNRQKYPGAVHGDDLGYIFRTYLTFDTCFQDKNDYYIHTVTAFWTNFAKSGKPSSSTFSQTTVNWEPTTKKNFHCLLLSSTLKSEHNPDMDRMHFWKKIYTNDERTKYL